MPGPMLRVELPGGRRERRTPFEAASHLRYAARRATAVSDPSVAAACHDRAVAFARALAAERRCLVCGRALAEGAELVGPDCGKRSAEWLEPIISALRAEP